MVSDFLTPADDAGLLLEARGRPVVQYTYRMEFSRAPPQPGVVGGDA